MKDNFYKLIEDRWQTMTIFEQLGNIASEISRAVNWENRNELESKKNALERALDLINLTLNDHRLKNGGLKEVARLQELVADNYISGKIHNIPLNVLYDYLLPFAVFARK